MKARNRSFHPTIFCAALALVASMATPSAAPAAATPAAEEVVGKVMEALGGRESWEAIDTMEWTGSYSTFSSAQPFRQLRKRPNLYLFDHRLADAPVVVGFDGETAWWENHTPFAEVPWPMVAPLAYSRGYEADAEFVYPFLDHEERGHDVTFEGETEFEGMELLELRVALPNGIVERWLLDPETHLPEARISKAGFKDFEAESRTFFSDYRPVAGILFPFHLETEVDNLVGIMNVEEIRVGVPADEADFALPVPPAMARLHPLAGRWRVEASTLLVPALPWARDETTATFTLRYHDRVLEEEISYLSTGQPRRLRRSYSWDRFRNLLQVVQVDDLTAHANLFEGDPEADPIVLDNLDTGTAWGTRGMTFGERLVLQLDGSDTFELRVERSMDGGGSWMEVARFRYTRLGEEAPEPPGER